MTDVCVVREPLGIHTIMNTPDSAKHLGYFSGRRIIGHASLKSNVERLSAPPSISSVGRWIFIAALFA